jgi:hypothetical protein
LLSAAHCVLTPRPPFSASISPLSRISEESPGSLLAHTPGRRKGSYSSLRNGCHRSLARRTVSPSVVATNSRVRLRPRPHQLPRLCCPHAVQCDALRYVLLQPIPWDPARACLAGCRLVLDPPAQRTSPLQTLPVDDVLIFLVQATVVSPADTAKTHRMAVEKPMLVRGCSHSLPHSLVHGLSRVPSLSERSSDRKRAMGIKRCRSGLAPPAFEVPLRLPFFTCMAPRCMELRSLLTLQFIQHHRQARLRFDRLHASFVVHADGVDFPSHSCRDAAASLVVLLVYQA